MAWNFRPGIRLEIVATLTVLMAMTVALVGILFLKIEERNLLQQKIGAGKRALVALQKFHQDENAKGIETSGGQEFIKGLQRVMLLFAQSQLFSSFTLVSEEFRVLADSQPERVGRILRDGDLERTLASGKIFVHGTSESESFSLLKKTPLLITAPLLSQGKTVGALRGELYLNDLRETHSRSLATVFLYILFDAILLILVGTLLLSRVIVKPLKKLVGMSEKIAEGNLELMTGPPSGDEVGKLFSSFNHMASRLRENREKMEAYIRSLEQVNRDLHQAQNEVLRSEKLASIGRLAAGIAHEVGNPTGAILGYLDLLSKGGLTEAEESEILQRTGAEAERIRRIIRELLDFSRSSPGEIKDVDVNGVIENALSLLSHQKKVWQQVQVEKEFQKDLPRWKGDPHQLQQVLVNLFLNAADAMAFFNAPIVGGNREKKLRVATRVLNSKEAAEFTQALVRRRKGDAPGMDFSLLRVREPSPALLPGEMRSVIQVEVADTGPGIPAEEMRKIFDPFYTTKPPGEGTGLGLAICLRILESYQGSIQVQSEVGKGTTFRILLPEFGPTVTNIQKPAGSR